MKKNLSVNILCEAHTEKQNQTNSQHAVSLWEGILSIPTALPDRYTERWVCSIIVQVLQISQPTTCFFLYTPFSVFLVSWFSGFLPSLLFFPLYSSVISLHPFSHPLCFGPSHIYLLLPGFCHHLRSLQGSEDLQPLT